VPSTAVGVPEMHLIGKIIQHSRSLTHLSFYEKLMGDDMLIELTPYLMNTPCLISLNLNKNSLTPLSISVLCYALKDNKSVRELRLSYNDFQDPGLRPLCKLLKRNHVLELLDITGCGVRSASAWKFARVIVDRNMGLRCLKMLSRQKSFRNGIRS